MRNTIFATGLFTQLDAIDVRTSTPTLATLQLYDAVLVYSDNSFADKVALGNVLADYVDGGGGVVVAVFAFSAAGIDLAGRIKTGNYLPIQSGNQSSGTRLFLVKDLPAHPILDGVSTFDGGTSSYHHNAALAAGATLVAHWTNNRPLVATKPAGASAVVGLNMYPPSETTRGDFWETSTDGARLMAKALLFAANPVIPSASVPPTATAFPPVITNIPDQTLAPNTSMTASFEIGGAIIAAALRVSVASSNPTLLPVSPSTLATACTSLGSCTLQIAPSDGRTGSAVVTVSVTDGHYTTSTSFTVTVTTAPPLPSALAGVAVQAIGSGFTVTWNPADGPTPRAYAVSWGTTASASNLPLQLVPGTSTRLDVAGVPSGTYYIQVHTVGESTLGTPSAIVSVSVSSAASVPGPPLALQASAPGTAANVSWASPVMGPAPTMYEVEVGSTLGTADITTFTTPNRTLSGSVPPGVYWLRTRAASGGAVSAWSSSVRLPVSPSPCGAAPGAPVLLPVTTTSGAVTFNWLPAGAEADSFAVEVTSGAASVLPSAGAGTSLVWDQTAGSFTARVVATNACGTSAPSNSVTFTVE